MKLILSLLIAAILCCTNFSLSGDVSNIQVVGETNPAPEVSTPHVVLMEAKSGTILFEKDSETQVHPASITKIMTLILIFDALESKQINLEDSVTVSEYAASMGGSQVYLEPYETQTVETMIKCIAIASANDACVAMAEHIAGSEAEFVNQMNRRAKELGMNHTNFVNCCGLDVDGHMTTAKDVALMSRELSIHYPQIHNYSTIWMDTIIHHTKRGDSEFGLTNTNRLIRQYPYATGLKTGSTSLAKYCLAATAVMDDMELIAVIMCAPDPKTRFADAKTMLDYGFNNYTFYQDETPPQLPLLPIKGGKEVTLELCYNNHFQTLLSNQTSKEHITRKIELPESVTAPIEKDSPVGSLKYYYQETPIGEVAILAAQSIEKANYLDIFQRTMKQYLYLHIPEKS